MLTKKQREENAEKEHDKRCAIVWEERGLKIKKLEDEYDYSLRQSWDELCDDLAEIEEGINK